jgi:hypothetical protein
MFFQSIKVKQNGFLDVAFGFLNRSPVRMAAGQGRDISVVTAVLLGLKADLKAKSHQKAPPVAKDVSAF